MKAQRLQRQAKVEDGPLEMVDQVPARPGPGQVRLRIRACGVCRTDLHIVEGDLPAHRMPVVPGHQIVGMVDEVGAGVVDRQPGERVGVGWLYETCGRCDFCASGRENLCPRALFTGYDADGGFADTVVVPAAFTFPIPKRFGDREAAPLLCAGIIGYRSLKMAEIRPGERVGLFGFGASAHLAIQVAVHWGCMVAVSSRGQAHRELAKTFGAAWVGEAGQRPPWPLDRAVVFAPSGSAVREALEAVRPGGTVAVNAIHLDAIPEMPYRLLYGERTLRSVANFTRRDAEEFLELAAAIPVRLEIETFPLESAGAALLKMKRRELRAAAVLVPGP